MWDEAASSATYSEGPWSPWVVIPPIEKNMGEWKISITSIGIHDQLSKQQAQPRMMDRFPPSLKHRKKLHCSNLLPS